VDVSPPLIARVSSCSSRVTTCTCKTEERLEPYAAASQRAQLWWHAFPYSCCSILSPSSVTRDSRTLLHEERRGYSEHRHERETHYVQRTTNSKRQVHRVRGTFSPFVSFWSQSLPARDG
jgi:hypothetical protein